MKASTIGLQLMLMLFVASARYSCDTGEKLHQTLIRYAALVLSLVGLFNCTIFQMTQDQIEIFSKVFAATNDTIINDSLQKLINIVQPLLHKIVYICNIVGIFLLLEPLVMQWHILQQRLNSVKMIPDPRPQYPLPERRYCRWQTVIVWSCSVVLWILYGLGIYQYSWLSVLVNMAVIMTTVFFLVRLQNRILLQDRLRAEQWLNIDNLLICIGLLGQMVQLISQGQLPRKCDYKYFVFSFSFVKLIWLHLTTSMVQILTQGILLFIVSQLSKQNWTLHPPQRIDDILNPLPMLLLFSVSIVVINCISLTLYLYHDFVCSYTSFVFYAQGSYIASLPGSMLFAIHSILVIVRFVATNNHP